MSNFKYIGDIERAVLGTAGFLHELCVDVAGGGHDDNNVLALLIEQEGDVPNLGAGQQEIKGWAQGIHREVVNLLKEKEDSQQPAKNPVKEFNKPSPQTTYSF